MFGATTWRWRGPRTVDPCGSWPSSTSTPGNASCSMWPGESGLGMSRTSFMELFITRGMPEYIRSDNGRGESACGGLAKILQSHQAAQLVGIQTTGAGGAYGREIHSRAGTMLGGRSVKQLRLAAPLYSDPMSSVNISLSLFPNPYLSRHEWLSTLNIQFYSILPRTITHIASAVLQPIGRPLPDRSIGFPDGQELIESYPDDGSRPEWE